MNILFEVKKKLKQQLQFLRGNKEERHNAFSCSVGTNSNRSFFDFFEVINNEQKNLKP